MRLLHHSSQGILQCHKRLLGSRALFVGKRNRGWPLPIGSNNSTQCLLHDWARQLPPTDASKVESWPPRATDASFDWEQPSNEAYHDDDDLGNLRFNQRFRIARRRLDYNYHKNPVPSRQSLQDTILERVVSNTTASPPVESERPWLVFSAGAMATGKGYVLTKLYQANLFPLQRFLKIDPDLLKNELPEFAGYLQWSSDPSLAATQLHRESTHMSDVLFEYALHHRYWTLVDGSLRNVDYYTKLIRRLRDKYPHYRLGLLHVVADRDLIFQRHGDRAKKTGRHVPQVVLEESMEQVPRSVERLSQLMDVTFTIENNEDQPLRLVPSGDSGNKDKTDEDSTVLWQNFAQTWEDTEQPGDNTTSTLPRSVGTGDVLTCEMSMSWKDKETQAAARDIWNAKAYPNFCPRCALLCDGQCGICIHERHVCACPQCRTDAATTNRS